MKKLIVAMSVLTIMLSISACGKEKVINDNVSSPEALVEETNDSTQIEDGQNKETDNSSRTEDEQNEEADDSSQTKDARTGEEADNSSRTEDAQIEDLGSNDMESLLVDLSRDFNDTAALLLEELDTVYSTVGDTYESYLENKDALTDWYDLVHEETERLFDNWVSKTETYFELANSSIDSLEDEAWEDVIKNYSESVGESMIVFNGVYTAFNDLFDYYYDGVLDEWIDTVDLDDWTEEIDDAWVEECSRFYDDWQDALDGFESMAGDANSEFEEFFKTSLGVEFDLIGTMGEYVEGF